MYVYQTYAVETASGELVVIKEENLLVVVVGVVVVVGFVVGVLVVA